MTFIHHPLLGAAALMRVGLISDTHDARDPTERALELLEKHGAEVLLHAGDLITGRTIPLLDGWTVWMAHGNGDWQETIHEAIEEHGVDIRYAARHDIELDGIRIGMLHGEYDGRLADMIGSGFDVVVHGHTHRFRDERIDGTRVVNPGAVWRAQPATACVYDTDEDALERIVVDA